MTDLFQAATRDESLFPPRCCRHPISFETVRPHLTADLVALFAEKQKEFGTLKRVYCANLPCSRFLGPQKNGFFVSPIRCPSPGCGTNTCPSCKAKVGDGEWWHECKADETDQQLLALSRDAGWARCPGCAQMIELHLGCYHMTCRCKTEFCYLCTARWKTCTCSQWDERRLVAAAEERVERQFGRVGRVAAPAAVPPAQPVRAWRAQPLVPPALRQQMIPPTPTDRANTTRVPAPLTAENLARLPQALPRTQQIGVQEPRHTARTTHVPPIGRPLSLATQTAADPTPRRHIGTVNAPIVRFGAAVDREADIRARRIREAVEELRVNHDCQHTSWKYRGGGGECQTCSQRLPLYLFVSKLVF